MSICVYRVEHVDSSVCGLYYSKELTLVRGGHGKLMEEDEQKGLVCHVMNFILAIRGLKHENSCFH